MEEERCAREIVLLKAQGCVPMLEEEKQCVEPPHR